MSRIGLDIGVRIGRHRDRALDMRQSSDPGSRAGDADRTGADAGRADFDGLHPVACEIALLTGADLHAGPDPGLRSKVVDNGSLGAADADNAKAGTGGVGLRVAGRVRMNADLIRGIADHGCILQHGEGVAQRLRRGRVQIAAEQQTGPGRDRGRVGVGLAGRGQHAQGIEDVDRAAVHGGIDRHVEGGRGLRSGTGDFAREGKPLRAGMRAAGFAGVHGQAAGIDLRT